MLNQPCLKSANLEPTRRRVAFQHNCSTCTRDCSLSDTDSFTWYLTIIDLLHDGRPDVSYTVTLPFKWTVITKLITCHPLAIGLPVPKNAFTFLYYFQLFRRVSFCYISGQISVMTSEAFFSRHCDQKPLTLFLKKTNATNNVHLIIRQLNACCVEALSTAKS